MFESTANVKFLGVEERNGVKDSKPWSMKEAIVFVQEFGRVKIPVWTRDGLVELPEPNSIGKLKLSCSVGKFGALNLVWDHSSVFLQVPAAVALSKAA